VQHGQHVSTLSPGRDRSRYGLPPLVGAAMLILGARWWALLVDVRHGGRVLQLVEVPALSTNLLVLAAVAGTASVLLVFAVLAVVRQRPLVTPSVLAGTSGLLLAVAAWWIGQKPAVEGRTLISLTPAHGLTESDLPALLAVAVATLTAGLALRGVLRRTDEPSASASQ